jgi:hypothetical protein
MGGWYAVALMLLQLRLEQTFYQVCRGRDRDHTIPMQALCWPKDAHWKDVKED